MSVLADEATSDPLGRGYAGMTDQALVDEWNLVYRPGLADRTRMSAGEIMEAIDGAEFAVLTVAEKSRVDRVLGLGAEIIIGPGNVHNAVTELLAAFGGGSTTVANLGSLRRPDITRPTELGFSGAVTLKTLKTESVR